MTKIVVCGLHHFLILKNSFFHSFVQYFVSKIAFNALPLYLVIWRLISKIPIGKNLNVFCEDTFITKTFKRKIVSIAEIFQVYPSKPIKRNGRQQLGMETMYIKDKEWNKCSLSYPYMMIRLARHDTVYNRHLISQLHCR